MADKTIERSEARFGRGDVVTIEGMPSYGTFQVMTAKWSRISGWWYEVRQADGGTWTVAEATMRETP